MLLTETVNGFICTFDTAHTTVNEHLLEHMVYPVNCAIFFSEHILTGNSKNNLSFVAVFFCLKTSIFLNNFLRPSSHKTGPIVHHE